MLGELLSSFVPVMPFVPVPGVVPSSCWALISSKKHPGCHNTRLGTQPAMPGLGLGLGLGLYYRCAAKSVVGEVDGSAETLSSPQQHL